MGLVAWDWGHFDSAPFLPRIVFGKAILSSASWRLRRAEVAALARLAGAELYRAAAGIRERLGLPRICSIRDYDRVLPFDFENILSLESAVQSLNTLTGYLRVHEVLAAEFDPAVPSPDGKYVGQVIVPFIRTEMRIATEGRIEGRPAAKRAGYVPGSEWLYLKLYGGSIILDDIVIRRLSEFITILQNDIKIDRWFFVRYGDPEDHLRIRVRAFDDDLTSKGLRALSLLGCSTIADGVWRVELGTYEPEITRYGGSDAIQLAESIFWADSEATVEALCRVGTTIRFEDRWLLAVEGLARTYLEAGLTPQRMLLEVRETCARLRDEQRLGIDFLRAMSHRFREHRSQLEVALPIVSGSIVAPTPGSPFAIRAEKTREFYERYQYFERAGALTSPMAEIRRSLTHMHANRMFAGEPRRQELLVCEMLSRHLESALRRVGASSETPG